jgi:hypothetical protein
LIDIWWDKKKCLHYLLGGLCPIEIVYLKLSLGCKSWHKVKILTLLEWYFIDGSSKCLIWLSTWSWTSWIISILFMDDFTNMSMKAWLSIWLPLNSTKISKPFTQIFIKFFLFSQIAPIFKSTKWGFNTTYKHTKFQLAMHLNVKYDFKAKISWRVQNDYFTTSWLGCNYIILNVQCRLKSKYALKGQSLEFMEKILW